MTGERQDDDMVYILGPQVLNVNSAWMVSMATLATATHAHVSKVVCVCVCVPLTWLINDLFFSQCVTVMDITMCAIIPMGTASVWMLGWWEIGALSASRQRALLEMLPTSATVSMFVEGELWHFVWFPFLCLPLDSVAFLYRFLISLLFLSSSLSLFLFYICIYTIICVFIYLFI